ncbi:MAG: ABC transporter substrate-binding protein [Micromonosporaceae bacterium]
MLSAHTRATVLIGALAAGALLASACSSSGGSGGGSSSAPITLRVGLFGNFGYKDAGLYTAYMKAHPNIKIVEDDVEFEQNYWSALRTHLASGSGLDDIQGIEVGRISDVAGPMSGGFVDLKTLGASKDVSHYSQFKMAPATGPNGQIYGLGTDIGPMGLCYRTDLFKKAGLPTDRNALTNDWKTWQAYLNMGLKYKGKVAKSAWTDTAGGVYNAVLSQSPLQYYDASHQLIIDSNPAVKHAWDLSVQAAQQGLTAKLAQFQTAWNKGFASGSFATIACPSWMIAYIKSQAGSAGNGKWDVTTMPGVAGNWGGSYLSIPKATKHHKEAFALLEYLTNASSEVKLFQTGGIFPSNLQGQQQIAGVTDAYFSNAPIGKLYSEAAAAQPKVILGHNQGTLGNDVTNGLTSIETQNKDPDAAWQAVVKQATADASAQ